jgi:predicted nuclease of restriction endonuclease-like (RecB) superfamily
MKRTRSLLPPSYAPLLAELKSRVRSAQVKAALTVNRELIRLYWQIGRAILQAQQAEGWGAKVVERLAKDLAAEFPEMSGFSYTNLMRMRAFAGAYDAITILPQPVGELRATGAGGEILPQPVGELSASKDRQGGRPDPSRLEHTPADVPPEPLTLLPWGTNIILLERVKDPTTRLWYAQQAVANGWSRAVLTVQIESRLHRRSGKAITNFDRTLPPGQSDLAKAVLKDPYTFDFLTLGLAAHERDLERGLVEHVLELGAGFAFVGRQVHVEVGDEDFYLDLLFYHLRLRCFVVVDLKMEPFEPEFAGKMNFYLSVVDDRMRHRDDAPTIGLLLCKDAKNRLKVEYALRDVKKPIGVAAWQTRLVEALPKKLRGSLPTIEELERELNRGRVAGTKKARR